MREAEEREIFQNAVDRRLSGLQENPFLAQRIMNAEKGVFLTQNECYFKFNDYFCTR